MARKQRLIRYPDAKIEAKLLANRRIDTTTGCWLWTRACSRGYGNTWVGDRLMHTQRLAAMIWMGFEEHNPLFVCHKCDVRNCFNPEHLFFGTNTDNQQDASKKGRLAVEHPKARADRNHMAKLTWPQVREIKKLYAAGGVSQSALAAQFGVTQMVCSKIVRGLTWRHDPEGE